jgi:superoxide dismutase, Fe-Mn family
MIHTLPPLPYDLNALAPNISEETLQYHHGKHHKAYVDKLNALIPGTEYESLPLESIIKHAPAGPIFNNAAQIWNHSFQWNCLTPDRQEPDSLLKQALEKQFGSLESFKKEFTTAGIELFGSGWVWLIKNSDNSLSIVTTQNARTPLQEGKQSLLTCDVWEHAYYIDYRNARARYLEQIWEIINWEFIARNFTR